MHRHTFVHRRHAHVIDILDNLLTPSPPPPSWSMVTNQDPAARAKLRINRHEFDLAATCTPDYTRLTDPTTIVSGIDDNHTVSAVTAGPLAHAKLTFDRRLAHKARTRKEHQKLHDTWNYITRFAFHNVGVSAMVVEEPVPF